MEASGRHWKYGMVALFALGFCGSACDAEPATSPQQTADQGGSAADKVQVYWQDVDEIGNRVIREGTITQEQKAMLIAKRKKAMAASATAEPSADRGDKRRPLATTGMTLIPPQSPYDYCNDDSYIWYSQYPDMGGNIFCARADGTSNPPRVSGMPFRPQWYWAGNNWYVICSGTSGCWRACSVTGDAVRAEFSPWYSGNLNPGSDWWYTSAWPEFMGSC